MTPAAPATLASWEGTGVRLGDVLNQLEHLRRAGQRSLASRTSAVTLVVAAANQAQAAAAGKVVHDFGGRHPARCIVLVAEPWAQPPGIDASVSLLESCSAEHAVWFEDIQLAVRGAPALHLTSLIEPFTLADLPVAVWYIGSAPDPDDSLVDVADAIIVDSKYAITEEGGDEEDDTSVGALPRRADLEAITALFGRLPVVDLAWIRLRPWRELLAGLFEGPDYRPFLADIRGASVSGKAGARALLAGWLTSRLHLPSSRLHLGAARHAALHLVGIHEGRRGTFLVERVKGERLVRSSAAVEQGPHHSEVLSLPQADLAWSLGQALRRLDRDDVYEDAVSAALSLA